jgi:tetratricopeptide (TPR) repeat protein
VSNFEKLHFKLTQADRRVGRIEAYQGVQEALAQWGLPLASVPAEQATSLLQQRPREFQDQLVAILHLCLSWVPPAEKKKSEWLTEVLTKGDRDPWRQQVRQAVAGANLVLLEQLLAKVDLGQQPPVFLVVVADAPLLQGKATQLALLRRAQETYPQQTLALDPNHADARHNLGIALHSKGNLEGAIACYRQTLELEPGAAQAHHNLGLALLQSGRFREALAALKRGHALGSTRPGWPSFSVQRIRMCARWVELDDKLPQVLRKEIQPSGPAEVLEYAQLCTLKKLPASAARFYAAAFAEQPELAKGNRYPAARAAALARQTLQHSQRALDLTGVREEKALARLPEAERQAWRQLWTEGDQLLKATPDKK